MRSGQTILDRIQPKIFICYRRSDSSGESSHLAHRLGAEFGRSKIFFDINAIESGVNYEQALAKAREAARVMLVIIGDQWVSATTPSGQRRIDERDDPVRLEVRTGLERGILLPVLVKRAKMPSHYELPTDVSGLASIQALPINHETFDRDFTDLVHVLNDHLPEGEASDARPVTGADHVVAGGAVDPREAIYIEREADTRIAEYLTSNTRELLLHAPRAFGKSSVLVKAILRARDDGRATAYIDLTRFGTELSLTQFVAALASEMTEQLSVSLQPDSLAREPLTAFLDVAKAVPINSLIVIDEVDVLNAYTSPQVVGELLATLPKISGTSSKYIFSGLFTALGHSHFAQSSSDLQTIVLRHFSSLETGLFLERARIRLEDSEFVKLFSLTGGHPLLVALSARALSQDQSVSSLVYQAHETWGPFGQHVTWVIDLIKNIPIIRDGMCRLSMDREVPAIAQRELQRFGLTKHSGDRLQFACSFYKRLLAGKCDGGGRFTQSEARAGYLPDQQSGVIERLRRLLRGHKGVSTSST